MGAHQSKDESLYQQVNYGNIEGIKALRQDGAGLEWIDKEGKTPLTLACMRPDLLAVAKVLIELGANVNAYRAGRHAGTPLHHAAKGGLEQTVNLLLAHGANPFVINGDRQTPLDLARAKAHCNVVRAIESRTCLFSGWLREVYGSSILEVSTPLWVSRKVWAVVVPCDSRNPTNPRKFDLAIYPDLQVAKPRVVIALSKAHIEDPKFNQPDPALVIVYKATRKNRRCRAGSFHRRKTHVHHRLEDQQPHIHCSCRRCTSLESTSISAMLNVSRHETRYKFLSACEGDKQQMQWLYNACRGIFQKNSYIPVAPVGATLVANHPFLGVHAPSTSAAAPPAPEDTQLTTAINVSIQTAIADGVPVTGTTNTNGRETSSESTSHNGGRVAGEVPPPKVDPSINPYNGGSGFKPSTSSSMPQLHTLQHEIMTVSSSAQEAPPSVSVPSAPPVVVETVYDGPIHYPSIDSSRVDLTVQAIGSKPGPSETKEGGDSNSSGFCVICLDAPVEGACIPCGHMAGCMSCLNEIKGKKWGCPVCRAKIDQVVRFYAV